VSSECRSEVSPLGSPRSVFERYLDVARAGRSQLAGRSLLQILTSSPNVKKFPPGDVVRNLLHVRLCPSHSARPQHALQRGSRSSRGRGSSVAPCLSLSCFALGFLNRGPGAGRPPAPAPGPAPLRSTTMCAIQHPSNATICAIKYVSTTVLFELRVAWYIHHLHCTWSRCTSRGRGPSCKAGLDLRVASVQDL
jgi:hypothetical protein